MVLAEGAIGRVARGLEVAQKGRAHLIALLASFLLGGDRGCDGTGTDNAEKRIFDGVVDAQAAKGDATRLAIVHPAPAAAVARDRGLHTGVPDRQLAPPPPAPTHT